MDNGCINQENLNQSSRVKVPFIKIHNCECCGPTKKTIKIANIQVISNLSEKTLKLGRESKLKKLILKYINDSIKEGADLIVLPELATSKAICKAITKKFSGKDKVIVMGSYIDENKHNVCEILIGKETKEQFKNNPSKLEKGWMQEGKEVNVFINTPVGDFAVLICYDATDFTILTSLQDFTDFIICIANNKDVDIFDHMFRALTYLMYQYIIFCNDGQYGGSCIYAPFHGKRRLDTMGVDNQGIIYRGIDLEEIDKKRKGDKKETNWKFPPASTKTRGENYPKRTQKYEDMNNKLLNYMNCNYPIFKGFLSIIYHEMSCTKSVSSSSGIQCMYPSSLEDIANKSCEYILDLCRSNQENSTQHRDGKQYFLFEIDLNGLQDEHI